LNLRGSRLAVLALLVGSTFFSLTCDGSNPTAPATPSPTESPAAAATASPTAAAASCPRGNYAPGPVTKYAISPRGMFKMPQNIFVLPMKVHVREEYKDEIWCVDKDQDWRLEFNSTQRNADEEVCCWNNNPQWQIAEDPMGIVSHFGPWGLDGFNFRLRADAKGKKTMVSVEAYLDGVKATEWRSKGQYLQKPLKIQFMSKAEIQSTCECDYYGNSEWHGKRCSKR
jgi:hypothetical protein